MIENQYERLVAILEENDKIVDTMLKGHGHHPATFGICEKNQESGFWVPNEIVFTNKANQCSNKAYDYIFRFVKKGSKQKHSIKYKSTQRELMQVNYSTFSQLSDHAALETELLVSHPAAFFDKMGTNLGS